MNPRPLLVAYPSFLTTSAREAFKPCSAGLPAGCRVDLPVHALPAVSIASFVLTDPICGVCEQCVLVRGDDDLLRSQRRGCVRAVARLRGVDHAGAGCAQG